MARRARRTDAEHVLDAEQASLLDVVDNALNKGVALSGDLTISLAQVDLIYARLTLLLCAADRLLPKEHRRAPAPRGGRPQLRRRGRDGSRSPGTRA